MRTTTGVVCLGVSEFGESNECRRPIQLSVVETPKVLGSRRLLRRFSDLRAAETVRQWYVSVNLQAA